MPPTIAPKLPLLAAHPLGIHIVVMQDLALDVTEGGIILPDAAQEAPERGHILAVGKGTEDEEMILGRGNHVLYAKYAGYAAEIDEIPVLIMKQSEVLVVLDDEE